MSSWPHAPNRSACPPGSYMVTASTLDKVKLLDTSEKLDQHQQLLFEVAAEFGWELQAWAIFPNHYHFVAANREDNLSNLLNKLHGSSSRAVNRLDGVHGRKVWYEFWDTRLTYERSYLARLNYVHTNPVKHGIVLDPRKYRWCSAEWFFLRADRPFYETVCSFKTDRLNVKDDSD
ncbi:MAG TPA: transposase [Fimbriimonadaceae bacterium]|nr:transposase [Fimbriimonadaceae bacterium]